MRPGQSTLTYHKNQLEESKSQELNKATKSRHFKKLKLSLSQQFSLHLTSSTSPYQSIELNVKIRGKNFGITCKNYNNKITTRNIKVGGTTRSTSCSGRGVLSS